MWSVVQVAMWPRRVLPSPGQFVAAAGGRVVCRLPRRPRRSFFSAGGGGGGGDALYISNGAAGAVVAWFSSPCPGPKVLPLPPFLRRALLRRCTHALVIAACRR